MRTLTFLFILFIGGLFSCQHKPAGDSEPAISPAAAAPVQFKTAVADLRLRETPGEKGHILAVLPKDAVLEDMGEVSDFTTRVNLRGVTYDEPWIKVKTSAGQIGWVYGGGLNFDAERNSKSTDMLLQKRALAILGQHLVSRLHIHRRDFAAIRTEQDFARVLQQSMGLRDTLVETLQKRVQAGDAEHLPDLFWISAIFTGYQPQVVAEGTAYYLFCDYRQWLPVAKKTSGIQDDLYTDLQLTAFPEDSIEYFFPAWQIQTWDYGGSSLLGKNAHKDILDKIEAQSSAEGLFQPLLLKMKASLVDDITNAETSFWYSAPEAIKELDAILAANYKVLSQADKVALSTRRKQLEEPGKYKISVNLREGR